MSEREKVTEQLLNAFVDDELDADERALVFDDAAHSPDVDIQLCEYRKLKDLVRHAYSTIPEPQAAEKAKSVAYRTPRVSFMMAAILIVMAAFVGGAVGSSDPVVGSVQGLATSSEASIGEVEGYIVHLTKNDWESMDAALTRVEHLLAMQGASSNVKVEVLTNQKGIDLLRSDRTPYAARISELANRNVEFIACAQRIRNLGDSGELIALLPEAESRFTALERVVHHLQSGWKYEAI